MDTSAQNPLDKCHSRLLEAVSGPSGVPHFRLHDFLCPYKDADGGGSLLLRSRLVRFSALPRVLVYRLLCGLSTMVIGTWLSPQRPGSRPACTHIKRKPRVCTSDPGSKKTPLLTKGLISMCSLPARESWKTQPSRKHAVLRIAGGHEIVLFLL